MHDEHRRLRVIDDRGHFGRRQSPVHGHVDRSDQRTAEKEIEVRHAVAIEEGDAIADAEALAHRRLRDATSQVELLAPRPALLAEHEHLVIGLFLCQMSDDPGHRVALLFGDYDARRH